MRCPTVCPPSPQGQHHQGFGQQPQQQRAYAVSRRQGCQPPAPEIAGQFATELVPRNQKIKRKQRVQQQHGHTQGQHRTGQVLPLAMPMVQRLKPEAHAHRSHRHAQQPPQRLRQQIVQRHRARRKKQLGELHRQGQAHARQQRHAPAHPAALDQAPCKHQCAQHAHRHIEHPVGHPVCAPLKAHIKQPDLRKPIPSHGQWNSLEIQRYQTAVHHEHQPAQPQRGQQIAAGGFGLMRPH